MGNQDIHKDDGEGYPFRQRSEYSDQHREQAAAYPKDNTAGEGDGGGGVISGHKDRAQQEAPREDMFYRILPENPGKYKYRANKTQGDFNPDDPAKRQVYAPKQQGDRAGFPQASGAETQEQGA